MKAEVFICSAWYCDMIGRFRLILLKSVNDIPSSGARGLISAAASSVGYTSSNVAGVFDWSPEYFEKSPPDIINGTRTLPS